MLWALSVPKTSATYQIRQLGVIKWLKGNIFQKYSLEGTSMGPCQFRGRKPGQEERKDGYNHAQQRK